MTNAEKLTLAKHACHIRMGVIEGTHSAKCGHPGGSLDIAELLSYLYFVEMNIDPKDPKKADRDRLVLSKGHAAPALYAALAERGYFPVEDLKTLRKIGSYLQGHPNMNETPGVDMSTGSLPKISRIPDFYYNLPKLQAMNLARCKGISANQLRKDWTRLANEKTGKTLQILYMSYNNLEEFPEYSDLKKMVNLGLLDLAYNNIIGSNSMRI